MQEVLQVAPVLPGASAKSPFRTETRASPGTARGFRVADASRASLACSNLAIIRTSKWLPADCCCLAMAVCLAAGIPGVASRGQHAAVAWRRSARRDPSTPSQNVVELRIDDEIEPILAEYIVNGIDQANRQHASLILITLSTPGGLDTSMRQIIQAILGSKVPVVTYVYPTGSRAASAGFFILLSADIAAMAPGTDTGAASPITAIGGQPVQVDQTLAKKILNEANAYLRSYVTKRGRNAELASTAVTDAKAFTEKEALDGKLIDLIANSPRRSVRQAQRPHHHAL